MSRRRDEQMEPVWALADRTRRALYDYVASRKTPVGRDEAAKAAGVPRSVAAYHLDKLIEAGLLEAEFKRPKGRTGPGAGRPAKRYRRSGAEVAVHVPPRDYELAAALLAKGIESGGSPAAVAGEARAFGERLAGEASGHGLAALRRLLADRGYEPFTDGAVVRLRNCPFRALVDEHRELVCGMNHAMLGALCDRLTGDEAEARLEPGDETCCVAVAPRAG